MKGIVEKVILNSKAEPYLRLAEKINGKVVVIEKEEIEEKIYIPDYQRFVGRPVYYEILKEDKNTVYASRKKYQIMHGEEVIEKISMGEELVGFIVNILPYGAYIEIEGVTGFMKNSDFAEDYTKIGDLKPMFSEIKVVLKKISRKGNIVFEAAKKFSPKNSLTIHDFQVNQHVLGVATKIEAFGVFVRVGSNLDLLCQSENLFLEEDDEVEVIVKQVKENEGKIRGKIVRVFKKIK